MRDIAQWACEYLANATQNSEPLVAAMAGATHVDLLASGASFSTAYKSALVLREVPRVMAAAIDCADHAHGWAKAIHPGYVAIVLAPEYEAIAARAMDQVLDRGGCVILVTSSAVAQRDGLIVQHHPPVAERLAPLLQAVICDAMIGTMSNRMPR
jgi:fructoselysine-6-P-deglycase FrlB-like protein